MLDGVVTYLKSLGGASGIEGILVACDDGSVVSAFINNPFPVPLWTHPEQMSVRLADISGHKRTLAVVDRDSALTVVDLDSGQVCAPRLPENERQDSQQYALQLAG
jgi:hypothetical protein